MKLSKIFNIGLVLAILILYLLHFSSFNNSAQEEIEETVIEVEDSVAVVSLDSVLQEDVSSLAGLRLAYVNIDTLNARYLYLKDAEKAFVRQSEREQKKLQKKVEALQKEYMMFVENVQAGIVDQQKAMEMDQVYKGEQMKLMEEEQKIALKLDKKRQSTNDVMMGNINSYLKSFAEEAEYDMIVAYGKSASVLYAGEKLDVTNEVIEGLNATYKASLK